MGNVAKIARGTTFPIRNRRGAAQLVHLRMVTYEVKEIHLVCV
jgi:hypothetical protein